MQQDHIAVQQNINNPCTYSCRAIITTPCPLPLPRPGLSDGDADHIPSLEDLQSVSSFQIWRPHAGKAGRQAGCRLSTGGSFVFEGTSSSIRRT